MAKRAATTDCAPPAPTAEEKLVKKIYGKGDVREAIVDEKQPRSLATIVLCHARDWLEIYLWIPVSFVAVLAVAKFIYIVTGRAPSSESLDWISGFAARGIACVAIIALTAITREQTGIWYRKDELIDRPLLSAVQAGKSFGFAALFAYILLH